MTKKERQKLINSLTYYNLLLDYDKVQMINLTNKILISFCEEE